MSHKMMSLAVDRRGVRAQAAASDWWREWRVTQESALGRRSAQEGLITLCQSLLLLLTTSCDFWRCVYAVLCPVGLFHIYNIFMFPWPILQWRRYVPGLSIPRSVLFRAINVSVTGKNTERIWFWWNLWKIITTTNGLIDVTFWAKLEQGQLK